jgi:hypothetical protein
MEKKEGRRNKFGKTYLRRENNFGINVYYYQETIYWTVFKSGDLPRQGLQCLVLVLGTLLIIMGTQVAHTLGPLGPTPDPMVPCKS